MNVYLPEDLAARAKAADLNVSALTQDAITRALAVRSTDAWLDSLRLTRSTGGTHRFVTHEQALAALDAGREEGSARGG